MSVAFTSPTGKMFNITSAHPSFDIIREKVKLLQQAKREGNSSLMTALHLEITDLAEPARVITQAGKGRVSVDGGVVMFDGEPINNAVTSRILWGLKEGFDMTPYIKFLENLMDNPSKRSVDELYGFLEAHDMGITDDGHILAYKRVRDDFRDIHSGKFDNSPGQILEMPRNKVDDDKNRTCSYGFHFCAQSYLPHFGAGPGNRIVIVKVNPRDVVSIPADYGAAKARACRYEILAEYEGSDKDDILATKAVWSTSEWTGADDEDDADVWYNGDDDDLSDLWGDSEDDPIRDANIVSANFVYGRGNVIERIEVSWDDGVDTVVEDSLDVDEIEDILLQQTKTGKRAQVRVTTNAS